MMGEKLTIKKTEDDYLIIEERDISVLSKINHFILKNEQEELAVNIMERNMTDDSIKFFINKQAAYNNSLHMIDEEMSPLGDIEVEIRTGNPEEVIGWITS